METNARTCTYGNGNTFSALKIGLSLFLFNVGALDLAWTPAACAKSHDPF